MKYFLILLAFCAGILFFQPVAAQSHDSIPELSNQQVEKPVKKESSNILLSNMPAPSFKIKSVLKGFLGIIKLKNGKRE